MSVIIDKTYFIRELSVDDGAYSSLSTDITHYEKLFLREIFDYDDVKEVEKYAGGDSSVSQVYKDILDGKEYTDTYGDLQQWRGLANSEKISPVANYVFYYHMRNTNTSSTSAGVVKGKFRNAVTVDNHFLISRAWTLMRDLISDLEYFLTDQYPDFETTKLIVFYSKSINAFDL